VYESVTDEFTDSTNPILKPNSAWICHIQLKLWPFCDIFAYFGQNLVAMATSMATSLRPLQSEISSLDWSTTKTPVISNHIVAISRRNAFICIYSNFSPKIGCHGNAALSLVYASVTDEFPECTALSQNQTRHGYVAYNWSYDHFCDIFAYFGQNLVAMATSLRHLQSEMSSLDWSTTKIPCISNCILVISHTNAFICIYSYLVPKLVAMATKFWPK